MEITSQTNYQLFKIIHLNEDDFNPELIEMANIELTKRALNKSELKTLRLKYELEYPSEESKKKEKENKIFGVTLLMIGFILSLSFYLLLFAVPILFTGFFFIFKLNISNVKKYFIVISTIILITLFYLALIYAF
jgi:hypothetical protein